MKLLIKKKKEQCLLNLKKADMLHGDKVYNL